MFAMIQTNMYETKVEAFRDAYGDEAMVTTNSDWTSLLVKIGVHQHQVKAMAEFL